MPESVFSISLRESEILAFYDGSKSRLRVVARDGRVISLPWKALQPFVTSSGLRGTFTINYDAAGRWTKIRRL